MANVRVPTITSAAFVHGPHPRHTKGSAARAVQARRRSRSTRGHEVKKQRPGGRSDKQESGVRGWRRGAAAARSSRMPYAVCRMPYAVCRMPYAVCRVVGRGEEQVRPRWAGRIAFGKRDVHRDAVDLRPVGGSPKARETRR